MDYIYERLSILSSDQMEFIVMIGLNVSGHLCFSVFFVYELIFDVPIGVVDHLAQQRLCGSVVVLSQERAHAASMARQIACIVFLNFIILSL
ncbi:hypothetical protein [uncultured Alistipes sp.]|uniref:hypothetical protein n=1 Tax=uncultured Alistipes sp. TaxID=538949 RepID=UPI0025E916CC|nr:hypothetical protein [uncultured Alistipes sp.]